MQIILKRYRNIKLQRREEGEILTVGEDITQGQADTLIRIHGAEEYAAPKRKKPAKENKASNPAVENK